jgi:membrane-associated phospholipid phosphatase
MSAQPKDASAPLAEPKQAAPPADLVHVLSPTTGFSYPSGHAVFFTWMAFMIAVAIAPKIRPAFRPVSGSSP